MSESYYTVQQQLGELYDRMGEDSKGCIDSRAVFKGLVSANVNEEMAREASDMIEVDHDGLVTKNAFISYMSEEPGTFTEEKDDMRVVWRLFREIDVDGDGAISRSEIENALKGLQDEHHRELAKALEGAARKLKNDHDVISFREFFRLVSTLPRVRGERVLWVRSLGLDGELARLLEPGTVFDGLSGLVRMSKEQQRVACEKFSSLLPVVLREGLTKLRDRVCESGVKSEAQEANSKFMGTVGAFHGTFATLKEFYQGPEGLIGQPNPMLKKGMRREHCERGSSKRFFVTPNYLLRTTAEWEWYWVQNPNEECLPLELTSRLKANNKYPGEVGDVLTECEIQLSLLKENFEDAALQLCKEDLSARLQNLMKINTHTGFELSVDDERTISAMECDSTIQIRMRCNQRFSNAIAAKRPEITRAFAKLGVMVEINFATDNRVPEAPGSESDCNFDFKLSRGQMTRFLQETIVRVLGNLSDEQCLKGARIVPRQAAEDENKRIILVIAVPCSRLKTENLFALSILNLGGIELDIKANKYEYCDSVSEASRQLKQGRTREGTFDQFFISDQIRNSQAKLVQKGLAELIMEEVIALRLYTGPLFVLYNAVLRGFPISTTDLLREQNGEMNRFETTIFVICSGISKLSRLTDVPPNRLLYRGLGGMLLPDEFWKESGEGFKGGVEYGLMSTTTKRSVAVEYSGIKHKRGIVLEIQAGRIDIGASISFLSQYPGEEEYLMQPLSCMEVIGHPRLEKSRDGEILVFSVRVNVNLKSLTVEDLTQRRKVLHLSMAKNLG